MISRVFRVDNAGPSQKNRLKQFMTHYLKSRENQVPPMNPGLMTP